MHLSDAQILAIAARTTDASTTRSSVPGTVSDALSDHLVTCADCSQRLLAAIVAARTVEQPDAGGGKEPWDAPAMDPELEEKLRGAFARMVASRSERRILRLRPVRPDSPPEGRGSQDILEGREPEPDTLPWAAEASPAPSGEFWPVLRSEDGEFILRFSRSEPEGPPRAYVISLQGRVSEGDRLEVPDRAWSFPLGTNGTVELPGITVDDLAGVEIRLNLAPLSGRAKRER